MKKNIVVAPTTDKGAISHLFNNLDFIISHKNEILSSQEYSNIKIPGIYVGGLYVGMHNLSLGDILNLWDKTEWHTKNRYYYSIIGTPLSGMNTAHWYDIETKKFNSGTYFNGKLHFLGLAKPALNYLQNKENNFTNTRSQKELSIFDLVKEFTK